MWMWVYGAGLPLFGSFELRSLFLGHKAFLYAPVRPPGAVWPLRAGDNLAGKQAMMTAVAIVPSRPRRIRCDMMGGVCMFV